MITLKFPLNNTTVSLQTEMQSRFISEEQSRAKMDGSLTFKWYDLKKQGEDYTYPEPIVFAWEDTNENEDENEGEFYLLLSETSDIKNPWVYVTDKNNYPVYNLKIDTQYFWCVQKSGQRSEVFSFRTLYTLPRCIKIEKISNIRDMGGYRVAGGRIRQGLVYRGGEFELHMNLNKDGIDELKRLEIRTELDMRGEAIGKVEFTTAEVIGIKRVFVPSVPYTAVFKEEYSRDIKKFFQTFATHKNYPIYYHCWGGADRTGTFAFILGAFLGMNLEDLINEYEFTSLSIWGIRSRNYTEFREFLRMFTELPGTNLQEKGYHFLKYYAGLSDHQLSSIRNILIEKI